MNEININANLYKGDCLDLMCYINDGCVDLILCDLPYGTTASNWDKEIPMKYLWEHYDRILKPTGTIILFANGIFTPRVMLSNLEEYKYRLVWIKNNSTNFVHAKNRPLVKSEDILIFSKGSMGHKSLLGDKRMTYNPQGLIKLNKVMSGGKNNFTDNLVGKRPSHTDKYIREYTNYPTDILSDFPEVAPNKKVHTNEKPIPLLEYLIKTYSNEGEMVLDNCMGSGTTGIAAIKTNRKFYGIEINDNYFNIAKDRIMKARSDNVESEENADDKCKKCIEFSEFKKQPNSLEQIKWERDTAITQLEELGYGLGEKIEKCDDSISRTDLIAAMHLIMDDAKIGDNDEDYESLDDIKEQYIEIAKGMVSVKPEIKWIPVSEKLPNRGDTVIATFKSPVTGMPFVATTHIVREPKEVVKDSNIIAWMPIMKPYKEKKE